MYIEPITAEQVMAYPGGATLEQAQRIAATFNEEWAGRLVCWGVP